MAHLLPSRVVRACGVALFVLVGMVPLAACGQTVTAARLNAAPEAQIGHVTIVAQDFAYAMPSTVPVGPVEFTFVNQGDEIHQAQFFRMKPGITPEQFIAQLKAGGPASTRALAVPWGGVDEVAPQVPVHMIEVMAPGAYVVACLVRGVDGMFHYAMGMVASFSVPQPSSAPQPYAPPNDGTVSLVEMSVQLPAAIEHPGEHVFKIMNAGTVVHALDILQLAPGKTAQDVQTYLNAPSGPPPFVLLGGVGGTVPGGTQWLVTHLAPGNYVAACLVVNPATGKTHAAAGMLSGFTVAP